MKISVIIPAFRQAKTIIEDLTNIQKVLEQIRQDYEMVVVIDGYVDNTSEKISEFLKSYSPQPSKVKVYGYKKNHGKGYAVRFGFLKASGEIVGFIDSGMDLNPNGLALMLEHMQWYNADIIVGSKRHQVSKVDYPLLRRIYSTGYQLLCAVLFGLTVKDTQVGLKFFKRNVIEEIAPRLLIKAWAFDIEILAIANYLGYNRIFEAPVEYRHIKFNSSVNKKVVFNMLWDTFAVFYRMHILHYYDESNKDSWLESHFVHQESIVKV